ncbi:hypothetical protein CYMTET_53327, partial [Cymbomonas tetramitiformis]
GHISLDVLPADGTLVKVALHKRLEASSAGDRGAGSVMLRRREWIPALHGSRKRVFLVRHGQSKWNEAKEEMALHKMIGFDHPLTAEGAGQAFTLRERWESVSKSCATVNLLDSPPTSPKDGADSAAQGWVQSFLSAGEILCSPLTRALQTALLALCSHPTAMTQGIKLSRAAREIKGVGGLDTVSRCTGKAITERVEEKLSELMEADQVHEAMMVGVDYNDTTSEWYTNPHKAALMRGKGRETKGDVKGALAFSCVPRRLQLNGHLPVYLE